MELSLRYKDEEYLICSSEQIEINGVIIELKKHNLKDIKNEYILDAYNNTISDIIPKTDIDIELELGIYAKNQEDISNLIDMYDDIKQIQDYNFDMIELVIDPTPKDKKKIKYRQKIKVLLDNIKVSNNIYNDRYNREITLSFKAPKAIVEILPLIIESLPSYRYKKYYYKLRMI